MFKSILASAFIAIAGLSVGDAAMARSQNCWIYESGPQSGPSFRCDVSMRINANGHKVWDIRHNERNGAYFSVILWDDYTAEVFINGKRADMTWYTDRDGDTRLQLGNGEEFIF